MKETPDFCLNFVGNKNRFNAQKQSMQEQGEIINKVAKSGLVNFDISDLRPKGKRIGIDLKDFLYEGLILREKDFRQQVADLDLEVYREAFVYLYCSTDAIVPLWAYFLITSRLENVAKKIVFGDKEILETLLMSEAIQNYNFSDLAEKRVLVKGCSEVEIPTNAYVELVQKLQPLVKSLMFGEACSSVPIYKK